MGMYERLRHNIIHEIPGRDQLDKAVKAQLDKAEYARYRYHSLKLQEEAHKENGDGATSSAGGPFLCAACGDPVLGSSYTCDKCPEFILHEKCAELPLKISHPVHSKHLLILLQILFRSDYYCDVCGNLHRRLLSYSCKQCNLHLDIQCASNLSNIKYAEHFSHEHILIFREEQEKEIKGSPVFCDGCREPVVGAWYSCRRFGCSYHLHKSCVELPLEIQQHPVHTEHPLILSRDTKREFRCDACNQDCSLRFTYSCFQCDFNLDLKCANSDHQNALTKHYTHEHALMFKEEEEQEEEYIGPLVVCDGCQDPVVLGPRYTCINTIRRHKCGFNLHKSCAELPREIQHPMHRQHPLFLLNVIQDIRVRCICNACNQLCRFRYSCSICDFNLDLKCASNWKNIIGNDSHKHQFTVLPKVLADLRVNCNVCGEYWSGTVYYMCSICQLLVHKECASLPHHITIPGHQHRLNLTWYVEDIYPNKDQLCKVCSKSIDKCGAVYCCHDQECCGYVAHTACAMVDYFREKENSDTTPYDKRIKHFSHEHELIAISYSDYSHFIKDDNKIITCESCSQPITTTTNFFYRCSKMWVESCHFVLHKICAEFPRKMFLPLLHSHPFTLLPRAPSFDGVFQCDMCGIFSQDFTYGCEECASPPDGVRKTDFYLDLQCSIYWENKALKHDSHVHRLLLNIEWDDVNCSGCGRSLRSIFCFSCKRCNFHLCIPCVKLPLTARHRYDHHPLKLTYASVEDDELGEYYCEICEGTRDPTHWFYYCKDCDFDCHPHCILGRYPQVKLGSTYKHDAHGQHLVTLVDKSKSPILNDKRVNILPCEKCKQLCLGLVFECKECNINFHREGCCPATDLASSSKSPEKN